MSFGKLLSSQSRAFVVVAMALALAGLVSALSLPIGLFPQVSFPRVVVDIDAGSRPADQTALVVTRPVEQAIRAVPGVQNVRSETSRGAAQISIDFGWGRDMVASTLEVDAAMADASDAERSYAMYEPFLRILDLRVPVIAAVNGHAVGGGFGLAMLADVRIVSETARVGANFCKLGLAPGMAMCARVGARLHLRLVRLPC